METSGGFDATGSRSETQGTGEQPPITDSGAADNQREPSADPFGTPDQGINLGDSAGPIPELHDTESAAQQESATQQEADAADDLNADINEATAQHEHAENQARKGCFSRITNLARNVLKLPFLPVILPRKVSEMNYNIDAKLRGERAESRVRRAIKFVFYTGLAAFSIGADRFDNELRDRIVDRLPDAIPKTWSRAMIEAAFSIFTSRAINKVHKKVTGEPLTTPASEAFATAGDIVAELGLLPEDSRLHKILETFSSPATLAAMYKAIQQPLIIGGAATRAANTADSVFARFTKYAERARDAWDRTTDRRADVRRAANAAQKAAKAARHFAGVAGTAYGAARSATQQPSV